MSDAIDDAMTVTMDRSGRLVVPKPIREEVGLRPGAPLRIRVRDGRIEIEPGYLEVRIVERGGFHVAEPLEPLPPLSRGEVRRLIRDLRDRRVR